MLRLVGALAAAVALLAACATGAGAATGTLAVNVPPDPLKLAPQPVNISGTLDAPGRLYVRSTWHDSCEEDPGYAVGEPLVAVDGLPVGPGPFSIDVTHLFGYSRSDLVDVICAWLDPDVGPIAAQVLQRVTLRRPAVTAAVSVPPIESGVPTEVKVTGASEAPRQLRVYLDAYCDKDESEHERESVRLTPEGGIAVGPGPFAVALPWTPTGKHGSEWVLCTFLSSPRARLTPDARPVTDVEWALPRVIATSPADGESGARLNPRFAWEVPKRQPVAEYVVTITRIEGDRRIPLLRMTTERWRALSRTAGAYVALDRSPRTSAIARVDGGSLRLSHGFWPGTYEWTVSREGHAASHPRRFVVEAKPIERLTVKATRRAGGNSDVPVIIRLAVRTGAHAEYARAYRVAGGSWKRESWRVGPDGAIDWLIGGCRQPGGRIEWRLSARDALGTVHEQSGSAPNASRATCAQFKRREAAEKRRYDAMIARYTRNCKAVGGRVMTKGRFLHCRSASGRELRVPGF